MQRKRKVVFASKSERFDYCKFLCSMRLPAYKSDLCEAPLFASSFCCVLKFFGPLSNQSIILVIFLPNATNKQLKFTEKLLLCGSFSPMVDANKLFAFQREQSAFVTFIVEIPTIADVDKRNIRKCNNSYIQFSL